MITESTIDVVMTTESLVTREIKLRRAGTSVEMRKPFFVFSSSRQQVCIARRLVESYKMKSDTYNRPKEEVKSDIFSSSKGESEDIFLVVLG